MVPGLMLLASLATVAVTQPAHDLVPNGGFEEGLWDQVAPNSQAMLDGKSAKEGKQCLQLTSGKVAVSVRGDLAPLDHRTRYHISAEIRTWQLRHNACYIKLLAIPRDGPAKPVSYWYKQIGDPGFPDPGDAGKLIITGGTHDWHRFHTTIAPLPEDAKRYALEIGLVAQSKAGRRANRQATDEFGWLGHIDKRLKGQGVAWVDDVRVEAVGHWPEAGPCKGEIHVNGEIGVQRFHGRDAALTFHLTGYDPTTMKARYALRDGWGCKAGGSEFSPTRGPDGKWSFNVRHTGIGYYDVRLEAVKEGTAHLLAETSYGILPKAPADYYEADTDSAFGMWVVLWKHQTGDMSLRDVGVKWTQGALTWEHWKYVDGKWHEHSPNFAQQEVERFRPQNVNMFASFILRGTPKQFSSVPADVLAKSPRAYRGYPPAKLSDMDAYVARNFQAYGGFPKVWGAFGEPNYLWSWRAGYDELVRCSKHFYALCKRFDPASIVIGPNAGSWNVPCVEAFLKAGGSDAIDGVDIHYNSMAGDLESMNFADSLRTLKATMRKHGGEKPIWITEIGVNCHLPFCTERNQAWRMVKMYVIGLSEGVRTMIYHCAYSWIAAEKSVWESCCSLVRKDLSPRPGYVAYGIMTRQLYKARYVGELAGLPADCVGHVFSRGRRAVVVAWVKNKSDVAPWCKRPSKIVPQKPVVVKVPVAAGRVTATDLFGKTSALSVSQNHVSVAIDRAPIYLDLSLEGLALKQTERLDK